MKTKNPEYIAPSPPLPTDLEACISITCMSTFSIIYSLPTDAANAALPFILRLISQAKNAP